MQRYIIYFNLIFILKSDVWVEYFWLKNKMNCFYNFDKSHMAIIARVHFWIFHSFVLWICLSQLVLHYLDCRNYMVNCQVSLTLFFLIVLAVLFPFHIKNVLQFTAYKLYTFFVDLYLGLTSSCKWLLCFKFCLLIVHCQHTLIQLISRDTHCVLRLENCLSRFCEFGVYL